MSKQRLDTETDVPESLRILINPYYQYYREKLSQSFRQIVKLKEDNNKFSNKEEGKPKKSRKAKPNSEPSSLEAEQVIANTFSNSFFEFYNVIRHVHNSIFDDAETGESYRMSLSELISYFNKQDAINLPLTDRVKDVLDTGNQVLNDLTANRAARQIILESGIDFKALTNHLLQFLVRNKMDKLKLPLRNAEKSSGALSYTDSSLGITWAIRIKYRPRSVDDVNELASEAIEVLESENKEFRTYVILIVFTDLSQDNHEKLKFNFRSAIHSRAGNLVTQTFLTVALLNNLKPFWVTFEQMIGRQKGFVIDFNYDGTPFQRGWRVPPTIANESGVFRFSQHDLLGRTFAIDFTHATARDLYVEFTIDNPQLDSYRWLHIVIIPYPEAKMLLKVQLFDRNEDYWMQVEGGNEIAQPSADDPTRKYIVRTQRDNIGDGWMMYKIDIERLFAISFGVEGHKLQRLAAIHFTGRVTIGRITFHP